MNVTFSVPQFPHFRVAANRDEWTKHEVYMQRFQAYAVATVKMQVDAFDKAAKTIAEGDKSAAIELQMQKINGVVEALAASASGIVERSTIGVEQGLTDAVKNIRLDVEKMLSESVSEVKSVVESVKVVDSDELVDVCTARPACWQGAGADAPIGKNNKRNRLRREKRRNKQSASEGGAFGADSAQQSAKQAVGEEVENDEDCVPDWRRKNPGGAVHKGVFSECSDEIQKSLCETRAKMLIAKNKAVAAEAEARTRQAEARLQSRMLEEEVERSRLEHEKKLNSLRKELDPPQGFPESIISALETPSLSDGGISPDSSISVAEVHAKDRAIRLLISQCTTKNEEMEKLKAKLAKLERVW